MQISFLCFGNEASRDMYVGRSVGWLVGWLVGVDTNFKKVTKMIYAPVDYLLIQLGV